MFRVEFFCEDKHVGEGLRRLLGIALGTPKAVPVINAEIEQRTGKIRAKSDGKLVHMFIDHVMKLKSTHVTPKEVQAWLTSNGMSRLSGSYVTKQAVAHGVLRPEGSSSRRAYFIIRALPKPKKG